MNLHEYQGKEILASYGVTIQRGRVATTPDEAVEAAKLVTEETGTGWHVIKAQVHAGGRGKGGGVKLAKSLEEVKSIANDILGMQLITPQTSAEGKKVHQILIAEDVYYPGESEVEEYYLSVLLDRVNGVNMIMYSTEGGMDIEAVAENTPELIFTETIDPAVGLQAFQARRIAFNLGLSGKAMKEMIGFVGSIVNAYDGIDASLFEINPVIKTSDNRILAVDAKVALDDNGLFRHKVLAELRDVREEDQTEVEADQAGLSFVKLDGNVGCMVNGAGLAMATMDIIKMSGGNPANFLDVGGTADAERVEKAFRIILGDSNVKAILVNIFGGIVRCDRVAQGIVDAYKSIGNIPVPIIVRLQGTNAAEAKVLIDESGLKVYSAIALQEAADLVKKILG
ncbi:MAG: ADP-forming succinate--CoA ligase subunit beta [Flavobacteriales bacterium]|jgi:succinyl-CoA synthetase beta subunit|nr:ADP-forming succinate--CoA ligase subunit beta [Flavobacteriales bacterium]MBT3571950.1 ADP-forming succinate--CoA ligase subunit beta [Flavobacteriales bacterium]MBT3677297.1 ADP-forming succinate--CoA ligase subunit beta [Flavobacteriales bacterium]MBT3739179.1 ADP-forming succinate--CoA ligase subunit beta [Flavobacteriales bacterium]MBT4103194.1 ADP-forming succinate--CoA ligase subunit beta [Flavobacteriales bacterium]